MPNDLRFIDMRDRRFSKLVVVSYAGRPKPNKHMWRCQCEMALSDACDIAKAPYNLVLARLTRLGWDFERAISQPKRPHRTRDHHTQMLCAALELELSEAF
jgi:hypothetical protein